MRCTLCLPWLLLADEAGAQGVGEQEAADALRVRVKAHQLEVVPRPQTDDVARATLFPPPVHDTVEPATEAPRELVPEGRSLETRTWRVESQDDFLVPQVLERERLAWVVRGVAEAGHDTVGQAQQALDKV